MMDDLKNGFTLAKYVVDLAKGLKDLSGKTDSLEIREAAVELYSQTIDLKETVNEMREHILELEERLSFKEKLSFNGKVFEYENDGTKRYICNGCEPSGKHVHMTEIKNDNGYHGVWCPACKNNMELTSGKEFQYQTASRSGGWMGM